MNRSRRRLLILGLGLGALAAGWQWFGVRRPALAFVPIPGAPGWRQAVVGGLSAAGGGQDWVLLGLDPPDPAPMLPVDALDDVLFGAVETAHTDVPVAVFTDFFCPYCRVMIPRLAERARQGGISVSWHELPLLGPGSKIAARAALAAQLQGGYVAFQAELVKAPFRPTPSAMAAAAAAAGLDDARLLRDMRGPQVEAQLAASASAARRLGIYGTPGLVVRRSVVLGAVGTDLLDQVIAEERDALK